MTPVEPSSTAPRAWSLPEAIRRRLGDDAGRQRAIVAERHLLLVLHAPPQPDEPTRTGRYFWRTPEGAWKPTALTHGKTAVGELLAEYEQVVHLLDTAEDGASTAEDYFHLLTRLGPLVRSARNLHDALRDARTEVPDARELILFRDRAYALSRRAELLQQDAKTTLDFVIARQAEQQADEARRQTKAASRLNMLAAFFFPVVTLSTVLGANLGNGLSQLDAAQAPLPLLVMLGIGLTLGALLVALVSRK